MLMHTPLHRNTHPHIDILSHCHSHTHAPLHFICTQVIVLQLIKYIYIDTIFFQGEFREENFSTAMQVLQDVAGNAKGDMGLRGRKGAIKGLYFTFIALHLILFFFFFFFFFL